MNDTNGMNDGWYPDPRRRYELRFFRRGAWTDHVSVNGVMSIDAFAVPSPDDDVEKWWTAGRGTVTYLGSHPARPERVEQVGLGFLSLGLAAVDQLDEVVLAVAWQQIRSVTVETAESIESRVTLTRVALFGVIGLFAKKTTRTAFLTVEDDRGEWMFAVEGEDAMSLWGRLQPVKARVPHLFHFGAEAA
jgi:hypothetical protein